MSDQHEGFPMNPRPALIVFSHLRWDFVWQRPQHLLQRLAQYQKVFFIEEPWYTPEKAASAWLYSAPVPNVVVCRPQTPIAEPGFCDEQLPYLQNLLPQLMSDHGIGDHIAWFYTPMALPLLQGLDPQGVVYDCMDELSAFRNSPPQMIEREADLLRRADVVFTGGPSLYRAKKDRHPNVH